ncbi:MaoC family dehydratase [Mesorhizobium microcysteis]|uniref:MaoC family dehydratase n=1 Tax=Neoaquamicrobium microcysteis TaxID=2682781 RepID=A0A5D4GT35_9HYPH|nr:MaoC family dehydratase [Mesorhizobium microcysteis]TYR30435.1 MaoC family dehydratase [Mesorhizobium microcysteis]
MTLDEYFRLGETITLGSHRFEADEIKAFAAKYDPQRFHMDEKEAEHSVFGRLCASGWHTAATWMKYNLAKREDAATGEWAGPGPQPEFGPSPGFQNLKWLKPVYAGETITFTRRALAHRALASRPGWRLLTIVCEAHDSTGAKVLEFESAVLVKAG